MDREKEEINVNDVLEKRPCSPSESIKNSLREMTLMRNGKKKKRTWSDMVKNIKKDTDEGRL
ncbi:hypothetical protein [Bacillus sp. NPDC094106]|uniref:hypothetical protein n=1 Tax=Bacillus sp. NPDC094106 TaxID=3363949 RepID=UPI003816A0AA